jgi:pyridoxal phosphate enzyme (YggS family)
MAVTKFQPRAAVEEARSSGIRLFGENRVQEAAEKFPAFGAGDPPPFRDCELHMIGSLQRNKAKLASRIFDCIQSIDREELIAELAKHTGGRERPLPVLLELHTGEPSKSGFPDGESLIQAAERLLCCPGLRAAGLMTMAPFDSGEARASFRALARAQAALVSRFPQADWSCLSMGMSGDFEIAVEEGSTLLRIGTAIFGERSGSLPRA